MARTKRNHVEEKEPVVENKPADPVDDQIEKTPLEQAIEVAHVEEKVLDIKEEINSDFANHPKFSKFKKGEK
jgi:hypothetical protein